jgi:hypothetical protein
MPRKWTCACHKLNPGILVIHSAQDWATRMCALHVTVSEPQALEGVRGALASDDALKKQGEEPRFRVRETPDWRKHAVDLEAEMLKRGMFFDVIDWSEDQGSLPFERRGPARR